MADQPKTIWVAFTGDQKFICKWSSKGDFDGATRFDAQDQLPDDVRRLVIAAREAWQDGEAVDADTLQQLDQALEAFADRVPWEMG